MKSNEVLAEGVFFSQGKSQLSGHFRFVEDEDTIWLETLDDFHFEGSPSPGWVLMNYQAEQSRANIFDAAVHNRIGPIVSPSQKPYATLSGRHRFAIPDYFDLRAYNCLIAWCYGRPELLGLGMFGFEPPEKKRDRLFSSPAFVSLLAM
ncbi:MAG: hypothetical protein OIF58_14025 [Cohaesibacter sp.]|nr:hypothetical protein [Cohaesibacter sp.]